MYFKDAVLTALMSSPGGEKSRTLRRSLILVTLGGMLAMVYMAGVASPVRTEFLKELGASEWHFGLLSGIAMWMIVMQFLGGHITNRIRRRKPIFLWVVISARLLLISVPLMPILFPDMDAGLTVFLIIIVIAISSGMQNMTAPVWMSWMADLIPKKVLNTYWGARQGWLQWAWGLSFAGVFLFIKFANRTGMDLNMLFLVLSVVGVAAGVIDILLFIWVREPENTTAPHRGILETLIAPLKEKEFRSYLIYACLWQAAAMFAAVFIQLYFLKELKIPKENVTLIWCAPALGIALTSKKWGKLADRYGQKAVLTFCISLKPLLLISLFFVTAENVLWVAPLMFFVDSFWNAGMMVAGNGYVLKTSPQENRAMFIAAVTAIAGICGGIGAMAGGAFLEVYKGFSLELFGRSWNNYHLLFAVDIPLRILCIFMAFRIVDVRSKPAVHVFNYIRGTLRLTGIQIATGFYRGVEKTITTITPGLGNGDNKNGNGNGNTEKGKGKEGESTKDE